MTTPNGYGRLPAAVVTQLFAWLALADHQRLERVDRRHVQLARSEAASPAHVDIDLETATAAFVAAKRTVPVDTARDEERLDAETTATVFAKLARYRPRSVRLVVRDLRSRHTTALKSMPQISERLRQLTLDCTSSDQEPLDLEFLEHLPHLHTFRYAGRTSHRTIFGPPCVAHLGALRDLVRLELESLTVRDCCRLPTRLERLVLHAVDPPNHSPLNGYDTSADAVGQRRQQFADWCTRLAQMSQMTHLVIGDSPDVCRGIERHLDSWRYSLSDFAAWMPKLVTLKLAACLAPPPSPPPHASTATTSSIATPPLSSSSSRSTIDADQKFDTVFDASPPPPPPPPDANATRELGFRSLRVLACGLINQMYLVDSYAPMLAVPTLEDLQVHEVECIGVPSADRTAIRRMATHDERVRYNDYALYHRAFATAIVDAIAAAAPKRLTTLDVSAASMLDDAMLERLVRSGAPLRELNLDGAVTTLTSLARLPTLTNLALGPCCQLDDVLAQALDDRRTSRTRCAVDDSKSRDADSGDGAGENRNDDDDEWLAAFLPPLPHVVRFRVPHFRGNVLNLLRRRYAHAAFVETIGSASPM